LAGFADDGIDEPASWVRAGAGMDLMRRRSGCRITMLALDRVE
jgi:hypothetical protein